MPLRLLGTIASSQFIPENTYYINTTGTGSTSFTVGSGAKPNSAGDVYVSAYDNNIPAGQILKYNKSGVLQWQKRYSGVATYGISLVLDSTGAPYLISRTDASPSGGSGFHLAKFNTSGVSQFQRVFYPSPGSVAPQGMGVDSSNNIYVAGYTSSASPFKAPLVKYNSSGTLQWQRELSFASGVILYTATLDPSDNVYGCGELGSGGLIVKYNSSGTLQYQRALSGNGCFTYKAVATNNNLYTNGWAVIGGVYYGLVCKFDSSGNTVWTKTLGDGNNVYGYSIALDASENVYAAYETSSPSAILIAKYNSSGTLQWQRRFSVNVNSVRPNANGLIISGDNIYLAGLSKAPADGYIFTAVLPTDGSKTGTYSLGGYSYTYAASSFTDSTTSITNAAGAASSDTSSYLDASVNYSVVDTAFTSSTVVL